MKTKYLKKTNLKALKFSFFIAVFVSLLSNAADAQLVHPGGWHTQDDLTLIRIKVAAEEEPWITGWNAIKNDSPDANYTTSVSSLITSNGAMSGAGFASWVLAMKWVASGDQAYADAAINIIDSWVDTVTDFEVYGPTLTLSTGAGAMAQAAEILEYGFNGEAGWDISKANAAKVWFREIIYDPWTNTGTHRSTNWGTSCVGGNMSMAIFCDDISMFEYQRDAYLYGYQDTDDGCAAVTDYIFDDSGQAQESGRDQAHVQGGIAHLTEAALCAWNQGVDLVSVSNNRLLAGVEYHARYNLGYDDLPFTTDIYNPCNLPLISHWDDAISEEERFIFSPVYNMSSKLFTLAGLEHPNTKEVVASPAYSPEINNFAHPGLGSLTFVASDVMSYGNPVSGFNSENLPIYTRNVIPTTIEAENYNHYITSGEGRIYHDTDVINSGEEYRLNEGVDIDICSEGGYQLINLENGEWLIYTIDVPTSSLYNVSIRYASTNANGKIKVSFDDNDIAEEVIVPFGDEHSTGLTDWKDYTIANDIVMSKGSLAMKISISGASNSFVLNSIKIEQGSSHECVDGLPSVTPLSGVESGILYSYYEGDWDNLPDFNALTLVDEGLTDSIKLTNGFAADNFAIVFDGFIELPIDGDYTFYITSDEGSRLLIDGLEVVGNDGLHEETEQSGDICLDEGFHELRVEYFEKTGDEELFVMFSGPGISKQKLSDIYGTPPCENLAITPPDSLVSGIYYQYYLGEWELLPDFTSLTPEDVGIVSSINLNPASAADYFALTFDGYINIEIEGDYTFLTNSDDGSGLWVDGIKVVHNDGVHGGQDALGVLCLAEGYHQIRVEYFENSGGNSLSVMYEGPNFSMKNITEIYTDPAPAKSEQIITFSELSEKVITDVSFDPGASTASGLPITYSSSNTNVAAITNGQIEIIGAGISIITASQEGSWQYESAEDQSQELIVYSALGCVAPWYKSNISIKNQSYSYISEPLDISCISSATISTNILGVNELTDNDYLNIYYIVDDGDRHVISENTGSFTSQNISIEDINGESITLIIEAKSSSSDGSYFLSSLNINEYIEEILTTDMNDYSPEIGIYPNPVQHTVTMNISGDNFNNYTIFNVQGQMLISNNIPSGKAKIELDLSTFSNGLYMIQFNGNNLSKTFKLIKE